MRMPCCPHRYSLSLVDRYQRCFGHLSEHLPDRLLTTASRQLYPLVLVKIYTMCLNASQLCLLSLLLLVPRKSQAITCYECQSSAGVDCKYAPKSCHYGFFGCVKIAVFTGGIDHMGNRHNEESKIVSMLRGCSIIPLGNVGLCEQSALLGYRIVKCTCFNDYCNSASSITSSTTLVIGIFLLLYYEICFN